MIVAPAVAVRAGLRALLSDDPRLQVIAEAASLSEIDPAGGEADVLVWSPATYGDPGAVELELGRMKVGEEATLLLIHSDPTIISQLAHLPLRAWGMLDPEATQTELVAGISALYEGLVIAHPSGLKRALANHTSAGGQAQELVEPLTERELEVLQQLALGLTNKQIGAKLNISAHTVKFHVSSIFNKLGTTNRVEAVNLGLKKGLIVL